MKVNTHYKEDLSSKIIEALKKGVAPWQKPWQDNIPFNAVTGIKYRGINSLLLSVEQQALSKNFDPRWATKRQARSQGWTIKDGAEPIELQAVILPKKKIVASPFLGERAVEVNIGSAFIKTFEVFHASQINGIPTFIKPFQKKVFDNKTIDEIIFNASARIFTNGSQACYSPRDDFITMPPKGAFKDTESYYSTLLHELVHWTGHRSRLDRVVSWRTGKKNYAREELVAEIASMVLSEETGLEQTQEHFEQHSDYVGHWVSMLQSDPDEIFRAEKEARKAVDFIMSFKDDTSQENQKKIAV